MASTAESFAKLKRDVLFHEKRIHLLYTTRILDDLGTMLKEHITVRAECDADCVNSLSRLERDVTAARMSGHWDEGKIYSLFQLEVPLRHVAGSNQFDAPPTIDTRTLEDLATRTQLVSQKHPSFAHEGSQAALRDFIAASKTAAFTAVDVGRMRDAVSAKLQVIQELDDLLNVIQESGVKVAKERAQFEALRRKEETARAEGEVALSEDAISERMAILQRIVDIQFFQVHTIDSTVEANVKRQRSNLVQFQGAASVLECLQSEKKALVEACARDLSRIERGVAYELEATDSGRGQALKAIERSADRLKRLSGKQKECCQRLADLAKLFEDTEIELREIAHERYNAIMEHVDLVESSRHATLDFMELKALAEEYATKLTNTQKQHDNGVHALSSLQQLMLQGQSFAEYDFQSSARRLTEMQRRLCFDLMEASNEYERHAMEILRRKEMLAAKYREEMLVATAEAETRKEIYDPVAKRYITRARDLQVQLDEVEGEIREIQQRIAEQRTACRTKAKEHLRDDEFTSVDHETELRRLMHREAILDLRQELLHSREMQSTSDILDERLALARETHPLDKPRSAGGRRAQIEGSNATAAQGGAEANGSAGAVRPPSRTSGASSASSSTPSSRVAAIRQEVQRAKQLPKVPAEMGIIVASSAAAAPSVSDEELARAAAPTAVAVASDPLELKRGQQPRVIGGAKSSAIVE